MTEMNEEFTPGPAANRPTGEGPQMSEMSTIAGIFFEPGRVFEDLRRKPRFIIGMVIMALLVTGYTFGLYYKVGETGMRRFISEQIDKSAQTSGMTPEQKKGAVDMQMTIQSGIRYAMPIMVVVGLFIGGLIYFLGTKAFGGD